jgi:UPF0716 family protein affecting phage T7 exclusion
MGLIYFLVYLFLEITVSYEFAKIFTPFGLFLEVLISAAVGLYIIKTLHFSMSVEMQRVLRREISEEEFITMGLFKLIGGILLFIPGVFSDILGLLLMMEPFARFFAKKIFPSKTYTTYSDDSDIIDVEIIEEIPKKD